MKERRLLFPELRNEVKRKQKGTKAIKALLEGIQGKTDRTVKDKEAQEEDKIPIHIKHM